MIGLVLEKLGELAGCKFDPCSAGRLLGLVYVYQPRTEGETVETIAHEGVGLDVHAFAAAFGASTPTVSKKPDRATIDALIAQHRTTPPVGPKPAPVVAPGAYSNRPGPDQGPLVVLTAKSVNELTPGAFETKPGVWMKQVQPPADQIAKCAPNLVEVCRTIIIEGMGYFRKKPRNLVEPATPEQLQADVASACKLLMAGKEPEPKVFETAAKVVRSKPRPAADIRPLRWEGEDFLALHELPLPKEGDWSAFREFTDRLSCPQTFLRWCWTVFLPEEQTGREALVLHGSGNDGKSEFQRSFVDFLGPAACVSEIIKQDNKYALAHIVGKRLVGFGDIRNPRPFHSRVMREITPGATLSYEDKNVPFRQARFHPRCLMTTNEEFRIDPKNSAEFSRVRRVNVAPLVGNKGDRGWTTLLAAQWPAFMYACRAEYEASCTPGQDIPITDACRAALAGGVEAIAEEHDFLSSRLEFAGQEHYVVASVIADLMMKAGWYKGHAKNDGYTWLKANGVTPSIAERAGKRHRVWRGLRVIEDVSMFSSGNGTAPVTQTHLVAVGNN